MVSLDQSSRSRRRPVVIGLVVLLVAALAVGAFFLARGLSSPDSPPPDSPDRQADAPDRAGLTAPPDPVRWSRYQGYMLPVSSEYGPSSTSGGLATGYSHTPEGALIANVQILSRLSAAPDQQRRRIVQRQIVGPAKQDLLGALDSGSNSASGSNPPSVAGFRFVSYTGDRAVLELVWDTPRNYRVATSVMQWQRGDWRLHLLQQSGQAHSVSDLSGYIPWSGVN